MDLKTTDDIFIELNTHVMLINVSNGKGFRIYKYRRIHYFERYFPRSEGKCKH